MNPTDPHFLVGAALGLSLALAWALTTSRDTRRRQLAAILRSLQ